jgi:hypothetical protein
MATKYHQSFDIISCISEEVFNILYPRWKSKDIKSLSYRDDFRNVYRTAAHGNGLFHSKEKKRYNNIFSTVMTKVNSRIRARNSYSLSRSSSFYGDLNEKELELIMLEGALENIKARHDDICPPD